MKVFCILDVFWKSTMIENFTAWPTKWRESSVAQRAASTLPYEGPRRTELAAVRIALGTSSTATNVDSTATNRYAVFLSCDVNHPHPQNGPRAVPTTTAYVS
jgi:hypothetical protein